MCANSEGSGETAQMRRLAWAFAGRLCDKYNNHIGERGGSVVECRTPEREVRGSRPTAAVLCPWARHFTPRKYWLITQEAMAPSRYDWKIVDWDVKPQHNQPTIITWAGSNYIGKGAPDAQMGSVSRPCYIQKCVIKGLRCFLNSVNILPLDLNVKRDPTVFFPIVSSPESLGS